MALKTFSIKEDVYDRFSEFCRGHGVSMSKQVEMFMESFVEEEPEVRQAYLDKLERIKSGKFVRVKSIAEKYEL